MNRRNWIKQAAITSLACATTRTLFAHTSGELITSSPQPITSAVARLLDRHRAENGTDALYLLGASAVSSNQHIKHYAIGAAGGSFSGFLQTLQHEGFQLYPRLYTGTRCVEAKARSLSVAVYEIPDSVVPSVYIAEHLVESGMLLHEANWLKVSDGSNGNGWCTTGELIANISPRFSQPKDDHEEFHMAIAAINARNVSGMQHSLAVVQRIERILDREIRGDDAARVVILALEYFAAMRDVSFDDDIRALANSRALRTAFSASFSPARSEELLSRLTSARHPSSSLGDAVAHLKATPAGAIPTDLMRCYIQTGIVPTSQNLLSLFT